MYPITINIALPNNDPTKGVLSLTGHIWITDGFGNVYHNSTSPYDTTYGRYADYRHTLLLTRSDYSFLLSSAYLYDKKYNFISNNCTHYIPDILFMVCSLKYKKPILPIPSLWIDALQNKFSWWNTIKAAFGVLFKVRKLLIKYYK